MMYNLARLDGKLRKRLSGFLPPSVFTLFYSAIRPAFLEYLGSSILGETDKAHYPLTALGLRFRNDLGNAAGLDKDGSLLSFSYSIGAGFAVVGTVLNKSYKGNVFSLYNLSFNPWIPLPYSGSAVNSLGLPSKGIDFALDNIKRFQDRYQPRNFPIGISIMGHPAQQEPGKLEGVIECMRKSLPVVDFIEINESCPNVAHSSDEKELETRLKAVIDLREKSTKHVPVLIKLADFGEMAYTINFMTEIGIDGLVGVNTQKDYARLRPQIDVKDQKLFDYYTQHFSGGISGLAIRDFSFQQISAAAKEIMKQQSPLELIHVGGIFNRNDVLESRKLAPLREWYTGFMHALSSMPVEQIYPSMVGE